MNAEPLICPQCGGKVNELRMECEYCGTKFKSKYEVIKVIAEKPGVHTLSCDCMMPNEVIYALGAEKASEMALKEIAGKMSKCIMPFISVQTSRNELWMDDTTTIRGRLRVVEPKEWGER